MPAPEQVEPEELTAAAAHGVSRLMGVGVRSGAVVIGLSGVRRTRDLALVFLDASVSDNTQRELIGLRHRGVRVIRCADLGDLTRAIGREDASVAGVKAGTLADGMLQVLT